MEGARKDYDSDDEPLQTSRQRVDVVAAAAAATAAWPIKLTY